MQVWEHVVTRMLTRSASPTRHHLLGILGRDFGRPQAAGETGVSGAVSLPARAMREAVSPG